MPKTDFEVEAVSHDVPGERVRTVLSIAWHDTVATPEEPSPTHVRVTVGRHAYAAFVLAGVVLGNVAMFGIAWYVAIGLSSSLGMVFLGSCASSATLLGVWLALSPWAFWKRAIVAGLLTLIGWPVVGVPYALLVVAIPAAALYTVRATTGWRFDFRPEAPDELPPWRGGGTLIGLFGVIAAWAVLFWFARTFVGNGSTDPEAWIAIGSLAVVTLIVQVSLALAILSRGSIAAWSIALGVFAIVGMCAISFWQTSPRNWMLLAMLCALGSGPFFGANVWLLKRLGWRLYQVKAAEPVAANIAAAVPHALD